MSRWFVIIAFVCFSGATLAQESDAFTVLMNQLSKSSVVFDQYQRSNIPLLMGNNEMGGLADPQGMGFYEIWFTDVWEDIDSRKSLPGIMFESWNFARMTPRDYDQHLDLRNGRLTTRVIFENNQGYESQITFLMDEKHRLVIKLINLGDVPAYSRIDLPYQGFTIHKENDYFFAGYNQESEFTRIGWSLKSNVKIFPNSDGFLNVDLPVGDTAVFIYSVATHFDTPDYKKLCTDQCPEISQVNTMLEKSDTEWRRLWQNTGFVIVPDELYSKTYFRSLFWLYCTSGSHHFLPAEAQFVHFSHQQCAAYGFHTDSFYIDVQHWGMRPFTYGAAGWAIMAFNMHGSKEMAENMLNCHFQPESLRKNVSIYPLGKKSVDHTEYSCDYRNPPGEYTYLNRENENAWVFAHQLQMNGENVVLPGDASWHQWQAHLIAFASAMFHQFYMYFDDKGFLSEKTYPVLKGTAEFWSELYNFDMNQDAYFLPPLNSLSEDLNEIQLIDVVLGSKWNLMMAARYANMLGIDAELAKKWEAIAQKIYIPQNDQYYIEYLNSEETREGGGYMGIRGFVYLGFPTPEIIPLLDTAKAKRTLYRAWERNYKGGQCKNNFKRSCNSTMITFISAWNALAEAYLGNGNEALEMSYDCLKKLDPTKTAMLETRQLHPYYLDSYAAFTMVPVAMVLQSYNDTIRPFAALPDIWKDVEFYNLPAQGGIRVNAVRKAGITEHITCFRNGKQIYKTDKTENLQIQYAKSGNIRLVPIK